MPKVRISWTGLPKFPISRTVLWLLWTLLWLLWTLVLLLGFTRTVRLDCAVTVRWSRLTFCGSFRSLPEGALAIICFVFLACVCSLPFLIRYKYVPCPSPRNWLLHFFRYVLSASASDSWDSLFC